jgi:hypothetical protein
MFIITWGMVCLLCGVTQGLVESVGPAGTNARILHDQGLTGKGVPIAMLSSGNALAAHEAFRISGTQNAVINYDFTGSGISATSHDTQVAGIVVSRGGTNYPDCRGVAPGARLHSARISSGTLSASTMERALQDLIADKGCRIVVTGVQLPSSSATPDGKSTWAKLYDYYADHYDVLFANASGNSESAITVFGDGYNGITTGGLALDDKGDYRIVGSISNAGPTADGRRKPDLTAPAQQQMLPNAATTTAWSAVGTVSGETSYAVPHTAGAAALLMERAAQTETPNDDKSLTIKAILINTANPNLFDKSNTWTTPAETVWHPHRGFGRLDAERAMKLLNAGPVHPDTPVSVAAGWAYQSLGFYAQHGYRILGAKQQRLVITLTWHRKLIRNSALSYVEEVPRFNLLLEIKSPTGQTLFSESDTKNNLRKADIRLAEAGEYRVTVRNLAYQQNRDYALAFELIDPILGDLNGDYQVDSLDISEFSQTWLSDVNGGYSSGVGYATLSEFTIVSENWLTFQSYYACY